MAEAAAMEIELHQLDLRYAGLRRRSGRKERAVLASLAQIGQQSPVVVLPEADGRAVLLDGYKRVRALGTLKQDTVEATAWQLPEAEALLLERLMRNAEADSALEQGWLIRELSSRFGLTAVDVAKRFDKSPSWVSRRLALVRELPDSIQEQVRQGQLQAHAAMKHLVPLAHTNRADAERVAQACGARQLTSREVGRLCAAWREGTEASRALILKSPEVVLRAQEEVAKPPAALRPEERLLSDFGVLGGIARRSTRALRESRARLTQSREEIGRAARSAEAELEILFTVIRKEFLNVGPESARSNS